MLKIKNAIITATIPEILNRLKLEINKDLLHTIQDRGSNVRVTCPFHKDGKERHPSCDIFCETDNPNLPYGTFHCFTCKRSGTLADIVSHCFGEESREFGEEWLHQRFGNVFVEQQEYLPEINLDKKAVYLDESVLDNYQYYDSYMYERNLSREVVDKFKIGYDPKNRVLSFPVWDIHNNLVMITKRSVDTKMFILDKNKEKPVYLLNFIVREGHKKIYVAESQINALTLHSWGYPAVALFGTGSSNQYNILRKSGIRNYVLCFDGDDAGYRGIKNFKSNMPDSVLISYKKIPKGKDVNDLTKDKFESLETVDL